MRKRLKNLESLPHRLQSLVCLLLVSSSLLLISGCSKGPLSLLTGGGPNVAANVQAGKTNNQTLGTNETFAPSVSVRPKARVDTIDQSTATVTNNELPVWLWIVGLILFVVGWVTDTPSTYLKRYNKK